MTTTPFQLKKLISGNELSVSGNALLSSLLNGRNTALGSFTGMAVIANFNLNAGDLTMAANTIHCSNWIADGSQVATLPAATAGTVVVYSQRVAPQNAGGGTLTWRCAGTDAYATASVVETRAGGAATFDVSTVGEQNLVYTPANAATNFFSIASLLIFECVNAGVWTVQCIPRVDPASGDAGTTGTLLFDA